MLRKKLFLNLNFNHIRQKSPPLELILSQHNQIHQSTCAISKIHFNLTSCFRPLLGILSGLFFECFQRNFLHLFFSPPSGCYKSRKSRPSFTHSNNIKGKYKLGRSQLPRGLRLTLDSSVRMLLEAQTYVHVYLCCDVLCQERTYGGPSGKQFYRKSIHSLIIINSGPEQTRGNNQ